MSASQRTEAHDAEHQRIGLRLAQFASGVGEAIARTAQSAGVLLSDPELRKQGASVLSTGAGRGFRTVNSGVYAGVYRLSAGPRQLRDALARLQKRIEEERIAGLLREQRDTPVDVQVGFQVYEDAPQELRSRLWMAVLEHPEFSRQYVALTPHPEHEADSTDEDEEHEAGDAGEDEGHEAGDAGEDEGHEAPSSPAVSSPRPEVAEPGSPVAGAVSVDFDRPAPKPVSPRLTTVLSAVPEEAEVSEEGAETQRLLPPVGAFPDVCSDGETSGCEDLHTSPRSSVTTATVEFTPSPRSNAEPTSSLPSTPGDKADGSSGDQDGDEEDWEVVRAGVGAGAKAQGAAFIERARRLRMVPGWSLDREAFRTSLMAAMMALPWPLSSDFSPDCRYATLLQISIGQEEVDEVISRDIHRTFPEHAMFGAEAGRAALFRVLKAYSLQDLEVGYCQGMAFVVGLLLFYLPEEPAFQVFCRLLARAGPNLRRFYLPGLAGLKAELGVLDALLERHLPALRAHLEARGVVPVLYASQWFLTAFACPLPVSFACRVLDGLLLENDSWLLARVALTLLAECEADLLLRDEFEELLTYLKLEPMTWPPHRFRRVLDAALGDLGLERPAGLEAGSGVLDEDAFEAERHGAGRAAATAGRGRDDRTALADGGGIGPSSPDRAAVEGIAAATARSLGTIRGAGPSDDPAPRGPTPVLPGSSGGQDDVDRELERHRTEMDEDFMEMVLELDRIWMPNEDDEQGGNGDAAGRRPSGREEEEGSNPEQLRP